MFSSVLVLLIFNLLFYQFLNISSIHDFFYCAHKKIKPEDKIRETYYELMDSIFIRNVMNGVLAKYLISGALNIKMIKCI